ncbi:MAG: DUF89 family protein [Candidatus Heimdallarchaeota archaeon]|nr:DUF89 family protein [Candidatus Heimdallarchaeota archaeon]
MKIAEECRDCIIKRAWGILERTNYPSPQDAMDTLIPLIDEAIANPEITWIEGGLCPAQIGMVRQDYFKSIGILDSYTKEKELGMEIGRKIFEKYREEDFTLDQCLQLSQIGNGMEFDVGGYYKNQDEIFDEMILQIEQVKRNTWKHTVGFSSELIVENVQTILYFFDNVGEHFLDVFLIRKLQNLRKQVKVVVKGKVVLNDVTRAEMKDYPLDVEILDNGSDDIGMFMYHIPEKLKQEIGLTDLLIFKGMANFETLSRIPFNAPQLFILKAKCNPIAQANGTVKGEYVLRYVKAGESCL